MGEIYVQYEYWVAAWQLSLAMLGMGATLRLEDFIDVFREPLAVSLGIAIQLLCVPLVAYFLVSFVPLESGVAIGIGLIAAIPGGTTSNIFTYLARGNVPLSISITGVSTFACLLTTPVILGILSSEFMPNDFKMPTLRIIVDITLTLLLPLIVGMLIFRFAKKQAEWISIWSIRASLLGILLIVAGSASAGRLDVHAFEMDDLLFVTAFLITILLVSLLTCKFFQTVEQDRTAIQMEVVVRNVNLAILIKASMLPATASDMHRVGDMVLFTVLLYGVLQMLIALLLIIHGRHASNFTS